MKTSAGYTARNEVNSKYVVWYRSQPAADTYYVGFSNKRDAEKFLRSHGINDGPGSGRSCGWA